MRPARPGFSLIELLVAALVVVLTLLVSMRSTAGVLGLIGKQTAEFNKLPDGKSARLRTVAVGWLQAQLELIKQVGFEGVCATTEEECEFWAPRTCAGAASTFPAPLSLGPPAPADFWAARIQIGWDAHSPVVGEEKQLRLVEVALFRSTDLCPGKPFLAMYTTLRRQ